MSESEAVSAAPESSTDLVFLVASPEHFGAIQDECVTARGFLPFDEPSLEREGLDQHGFEFVVPDPTGSLRCRVVALDHRPGSARLALEHLLETHFGPIVILGPGTPLRDDVRPGDVIIGDAVIGVSVVEADEPKIERTWRRALAVEFADDLAATEAYSNWRSGRKTGPTPRVVRGSLAAVGAAKCKSLREWLSARGETSVAASADFVDALEFEAESTSTRLAILLGIPGDTAEASIVDVWRLAAELLRARRWPSAPVVVTPKLPKVDAPTADAPTADAPTADAPSAATAAPSEASPPPARTTWPYWLAVASTSIALILGFFLYRVESNKALIDVLDENGIVTGINQCFAIAKQGYISVDSDSSGSSFGDGLAPENPLVSVKEGWKIEQQAADSEVVKFMVKHCVDAYQGYSTGSVSLSRPIADAKVWAVQAHRGCETDKNGTCLLEIPKFLADDDLVDVWVEIAGEREDLPREQISAAELRNGVKLEIRERCRIQIRDQRDIAMTAEDFEEIQVILGKHDRQVLLSGKTLDFACRQDEHGQDIKVHARLRSGEVREWPPASKPLELAPLISLELADGRATCEVRFVDNHKDRRLIRDVDTAKACAESGNPCKDLERMSGDAWTFDCRMLFGMPGRFFYARSGKYYQTDVVTFGFPVVELNAAVKRPQELKSCDNAVTAALRTGLARRNTSCTSGDILVSKGRVMLPGKTEASFQLPQSSLSCKAKCPL